MKKVKLFLQKPFIKNTVAPIVRGAVKMIPIIGTPVSELVTNATLPDGVPKKHSNLSQMIQWSVVILIVVDIIFNKGGNLKSIFDFTLSFA